ncbi:hypothetical protein B0H17DRAFT_13009 [Mycena rosella]|uniref:Uncharacterized protein n=1 Tax=Mycena rosella TaxID=1033263 RepID=A0AAD7M7D5_MYCRO|nr:hypothetical protein B0H17DRAFT_13009 [Mycena rosella]
MCRRSKTTRKRNISRLWISPPLMQGDDDLDDAYSPVSRRRPRRANAGIIRPFSNGSLEITPVETIPGETDGMDANLHYDADTWGAARASPNAFLVASSLPSVVPLSPEYWMPPTSDAAFPNAHLAQPEPADKQPSAISAKGFMRRLRRGRPSMASRGLLTTLAPVLENPNSPMMSTTEFSRPPSSLSVPLHSPVSVSRPLPVSNNYSLPWIHRTRGPIIDMPGWTPPPT